MQECGISHRPYLSIAEKSTQWDLPQFILEHVGIVVCFSIKVFTSAEARE
jgi:hypothetical protein